MAEIEFADVEVAFRLKREKQTAASVTPTETRGHECQVDLGGDRSTPTGMSIQTVIRYAQSTAHKANVQGGNCNLIRVGF